jgi:(2Fe-2S) ferredoxin
MKQVLICQHINCQRNGSVEVLTEFQAHPMPDVEIVPSECQGQCNMGATVRILPDETWYCRVQPADVPIICQQHLQQGTPVDRLLHPRFHPNIG